MPVLGASPAFGAPGVVSTVTLKIAFAKSGSVTALTEGARGFTVGATLSSGVGTLTFPKTFSFLTGVGSSTEAGKSIRVHDVDLTAGTASFTVLDTAGAAEEPAANDTLYIALTCKD